MNVETVNLSKTYRRQGRAVQAVRHACIRIGPGETVGLWGQSGSGKSTLARMICGLETPTEGELRFDGQAVRRPFSKELWRKVQTIFQHPEVSFNPRLTLETSLLEPYVCHHIPVTRESLLASMSPYGLYAEHLKRYPSELSGGELQRAAIVRALTLKPEFMVLDEPTSMLDSISRAQMMRLFARIQRDSGTSFLLISHSRAVVSAFCHRVYQVDDGNVVLMEGLYENTGRYPETNGR